MTNILSIAIMIDNQITIQKEKQGHLTSVTKMEQKIPASNSNRREGLGTLVHHIRVMSQQ